MARYAYHRLDANHQEIREALEQIGATVKPAGFVDLAVGWQGDTYFLEVKTRTGKLNAKQRKFVETWRGHVAVVRSVEDALRVLGVR